MNKKQKRILIRIILSAALFIPALLIPSEGWVRLIMFLPSYLLVGWDVLLRAVRNIARGQVFDENFLMSLATVGAFGVGEYPEGALVMLLYQIGELFQSYAVDRSRKSISNLMDIRPDYANIERDGKLVQIDPDEAQIGDIIIVKTGEKIPLDGRVVKGSARVDTSALTGESVPRSLKIGDEALSGCVNLDGLVSIEATKEFGESTASKILDLVENASDKKARAENFITKFAKYYTPLVVIAAVIIAFVPPLIVTGATFADWIHRALTFLVISCPCALVISVPMGFFGGIGGASKLGILMKGGNYMDVLSKAEIVVFDKTGTLTKGNFTVTEIHPKNISKDQLLEYAAFGESYSDHPISLSLKKAYGKEIDISKVSDVKEIAGQGVSADYNGKRVSVGNGRLMDGLGLEFDNPKSPGALAHVAVDGKYMGYIIIADEIKPDSVKAIRDLKNTNGVKKTAMLTGDTKAAADMTAAKLSLDTVYSQLLPADKIDKVEELMDEKSVKGSLIFVGDGINDAPVLTRADAGIAMGGLGSDAAIEAADVVIMDDKPSKISAAIGISKRTLKIVRQNIVFALGIKSVFLILGVMGIANMWLAVFADVGVSIIAILNSMRALNTKPFENDEINDSNSGLDLDMNKIASRTAADI